MILYVGSYHCMTTGTHHILEVLNNELMISLYQITLSHDIMLYQPDYDYPLQTN